MLTVCDTDIYAIVLCFIAGHLCGSVPSGLWLCKALYGIDIRSVGSRNIGTTNVFRTAGPLPAALVLFCDIAKGVIAVAAVRWLFAAPVLEAVCALGAFLGHNFSAFLGLKGGKGVATGVGLLLFLMPKAAAVAVAVWLALVLTTRYVSLGSIIAGCAAPAAAWYFSYPPPYLAFAFFAAFIVVLRHKANIERLLAGSEPKIKAGHLEKKS